MLREQTIIDEIEKNNCKLLGQIEVSDEDYQYLIDYARKRIKYLYMQTIVKTDLLLSLAMVQIAIRHYKEGKYWSCFIEELGVDISGTKLNYLGQIFHKTIKVYNLFEVKRDEEKSSQLYVESIKTHAFVANYYLEGFFDFAYAFFENNLFRDLTDDIQDDIEELSEFMLTTLDSNKDDIMSDSSSKKAAKSYRLLKSTRVAFAQCDANTINNILYPILTLIDRYYYEDEIPKVTSNRYELGFIDWCKKQKESEPISRKIDRTAKRLHSHKPYIKIDIRNGYTFLVIPQQKIRNSDCEGIGVVAVEINGHTEERQMELYRSFGIYISEELVIPIPSVFDEINIIIKTNTEKEYQIKKSNYRIFNGNYQSIEKFHKGHNYILVKPEVDVEWLNENDLIDYDDSSELWKSYSANITDDSVCYVGNKPLSIIGEFSSEPVYEYLVDKFSIFGCDGKKKTVTRTHPTISFVIDKNKINGTVIIVNQLKYRINEIQHKNCYDWPKDKSRVAINIMLNDFLNRDIGTYEVILSVPGENDRHLCEYLLIGFFNCKLDKRRYTYDNEAILTILNYGIEVKQLNESWKCDIDDEKKIIYKIPLSADLKELELTLFADKEYKLIMPILMFSYGFSQVEMRIDRPRFLWYADLSETVYVKIPGASKVNAWLGNDVHNKSYGVEISQYFFRIDISEFVRRIADNSRSKWQYINVEYEDNAIRHISLPVILRTLLVDPYFELKMKDGVVCIEAEINGNADLYVDVATIKTKEKIVEHRQITTGITKFPELMTNTVYDIYPCMEESDDFGFDVKTTLMKPMSNCVCIDDKDLVNCQLPIKKIIYREEIMDVSFDYFINVTEKIDDATYEGYMFGFKLSNGRNKGRYLLDVEGKRKKIKLGKVRFEVLVDDENLELNVLFYSYAEDEWMFPYYDSCHYSQYLIGPDSPILQNTGQEYIERLIELTDDTTIFQANIQKMRRF